MNERFFSLPEEKQQAILNAGYRVFSENSYKSSPMSEIAGAAGISKSLLFHYFRNKRELYLYLWEQAARVTMESLEGCQCYARADLFEAMELGMQAKLEIVRRCPDMAAFAIKAFYERDPEVCGDIQASYHRHFDLKSQTARFQLDPERFVPGLDLAAMFQEMYWAAAGCLWERMRRGRIDPQEMERDFRLLIDFWKSVYLRER